MQAENAKYQAEEDRKSETLALTKARSEVKNQPNP
ncbi:hypothetical protein Za10_1649 [Zymomonas mobilis subsp. mobilis NCIMB 11163]|nr:hypothetical protein Za10_1649 [Zymomonas mobilis subsp. mobilis NCIMB 11163]